MFEIGGGGGWWARNQSCKWFGFIGDLLTYHTSARSHGLEGLFPWPIGSIRQGSSLCGGSQTLK